MGGVFSTRGRGRLLGAGLTVVAGAGGWLLAGPPGDATAITPPSCPPSFDRGVDDASAAGSPIPDRPGTVDGLVPAGPVSVRVCGYSSPPGASGSRLERSRVLDPIWTSELAALLDRQDLDGRDLGRQTPGRQTLGRQTPGRQTPGRVADPVQRAACTPGGAPALLVFRYRQGPPLTVASDGGTCSAVWTPARLELGRTDVHRRVAELLAD